MHIVLSAPGGLGNKIIALSPWLALGRAAGRRVTFNGPSIIWSDYFTSDLHRAPEGILAQACGLDASTSNVSAVLRCDVSASNRRCRSAVFHEPETALCFVGQTNHGASLDYVLGVDEFTDAYLGEAWNATTLAAIAQLYALEIPLILQDETVRFLDVVENFTESHRLKSTASSPWLFDLGLHLRSCVDCGWRMHTEAIAANIACMVQRLPPLQKGAIVFLTSDTREHIELIRSLLPVWVSIIEEIPPSLLHTTRLKGFENLVPPYLDMFLLGECRYVASCWTTYGMAAALRRGRDPGRLQHILKWVHKNNHRIITNETRGAQCALLPEIIKEGLVG